VSVCVCVWVSYLLLRVSQLGPNIKELFRLIEDFVDVVGLRMKDFQDMYEVTDNLGRPSLPHVNIHIITAAVFHLLQPFKICVFTYPR